MLGSDMHDSLLNHWFEAILFVNSREKNRELIRSYFFDSFAQAPEAFFEFMKFYREKLESEYNPNIKTQIASKYLRVLSPLCERFGLHQEKGELDDLCFQITDPQTYGEIVGICAQYQESSNQILRRISAKLKQLLIDNQYNCQVKGRYKTIYSIYRKLQKKRRHHDILKLNDIFAFRVIILNNSIDDCFEVMNLLHDNYFPIADSFKDYITIPKINGYQSLHTGLRGVSSTLDLPIEVQIRTQTMDDFAERGLAAHWLYATSKKSRLIPEKEKQLYQYLTYLPDSSVQQEKIYCFSDRGDIFQLRHGATAHDFAGRIHSSLAKQASHAIINGKNEPLDYQITNGDRIHIVKQEPVTAN